MAWYDRHMETLLNIDLTIPRRDDPRPPQALEDWTHVYDGLSDEQIGEIDRIAKTRAKLTRNLP